MEWENKEREGDVEEKFNNIKSESVRGFSEASKKRKNNLLFFFPAWNIEEEQEQSCWAVKSAPACLSRVPIGVQLPRPCFSPPGLFICIVNPETLDSPLNSLPCPAYDSSTKKTTKKA